MLSTRIATCLASLGLAAAAAAQTGTLDQVSPFAGGSQSSSFNVDASFLVWQCQVRAGITGQLEGFNIRLQGNQGTQVNTGVRIGDGWNTNPFVFSGPAIKTFTGDETIFVDTTAANIPVTAGQTFVIELWGTNSGNWALGTYVDPATGGAPMYPEPLYLNSPPCFSNCGWRIGFETYVMSGGQTSTYCTAGTTTHGCLASISGTGTPSASAASGFDVSISNVEGQQTGMIFYGINNSGFTPLPWGTSTSFMCVKSPLNRIQPQNSGGTLGSCDGSLSIDWNAYRAANPSALGQPFTVGQHVYAQGWFRDPPSPKTTMLSDGLDFVVQP